MTTIAIGGIMHESNTFSDTPTDYAAFSHTYASNIIKTWGESHHEIGGFIQGANDYNYTAYPMMMASATPAGPRDGRRFRPTHRYAHPAPQIRPAT